MINVLPKIHIASSESLVKKWLNPGSVIGPEVCAIAGVIIVIIAPPARLPGNRSGSAAGSRLAAVWH